MGGVLVHPHVLVFRQTGPEESLQQRKQRKQNGSRGEKLLEATRGSHTIALETHSAFTSTVISDQYLVLHANEMYTLQLVRSRCS